MSTVAETDVVVVGFGAAGIAAALSAAQAGADVVICEKQPAARHTPTSKMGGSYFMTVTDVDAATRYLARCADGLVPLSVTRRWAELASTLKPWMERLQTGLEFELVDNFLGKAAYPEFEGAGAVLTWFAKMPDSTGKVGVEFHEALAGVARRHPRIEVRWETPGQRLVRGPDGRIIGIRVGSANDAPMIRARRGVILATGGFDFDEGLKRHYLKAHPIHFAGNPGNTGDGLRMAQAVGASLWHMNAMEGRFVTHFPLPDGQWVNVQPNLNPPGYVVTDRHGKRFSNEFRYTRIETFWYEAFDFDPMRRTYTRIPFYWFFDQRRLKAGPLTPRIIGQPAVGLYDWSPDNGAEIERGWIHMGKSIEEVARHAGLDDPEEAARTVAAYNDGVQRGEDVFGRPVPSLVPLDTPPFCCVKLYPGGVGTAGGPAHDAQGRVLDAFGMPIQGLYAAGQVGQMIGTLYPSPGAGFSEALCAGIMAGTAAADNS